MAAQNTDLLAIERAGVLHKVTAAQLAALGGGLPAGGTTGQVLTKASATDGDADWQTPAAGGGSGLASGQAQARVTGNVFW